MTQPWIRSQLRPETDEERQKRLTERLKEIDRQSRERKQIGPWEDTEISAPKATSFRPVGEIGRTIREIFTGSGVRVSEQDGLIGTLKERGLIGSAKRFLGINTQTDRVKDVANKLMDEGVDESRAWVIAQENVRIQVPGGSVSPTKTIEPTEEEQKAVDSVLFWQNLDDWMNRFDLVSLGVPGRIKMGAEAVETMVQNFARSKNIRRITMDLIDQGVPVNDATRLAKRIAATDSEKVVARAMSDYVQQAAKKTQATPTPRPTAQQPVRPSVPTRPVRPTVTPRAAVRVTPEEAAALRPREATDADVVLSIVDNNQNKFFTRISTRELQNLIEETKNIPPQVEGYRQIHLDAVTGAQKETGQEVSREVFASLSPQTKGVLTQAVNGKEVSMNNLYQLNGERVNVTDVRGGMVEIMRGPDSGYARQTMSVDDFYNKAQQLPQGQLGDTAPLTRAKNTYAKDAAEVTQKVESRTKEGVVKLTGELLTPISSRLERINTALFRRLRRFEKNVAKLSTKDAEAVLPLIRMSKKMSREDAAVWDLARKNADGATIDALAKKYGFEDELAETRRVLDDIHARAKEVGMDINYYENYFPRVVRDPDALMKYLRGTDEWSDLDEFIRAVAHSKGKKYTQLTTEEKVAIINNNLRGYGDKITLTAPSFSKQRNIDIVDADINRFYEASDDALATYVIRMNDEIEARRFFGQGENIHESIGEFVIREAADGKLNPQDIDQVTSLLQSRFHRGTMNGALQVYRNAEYISTMGSFTSALTQLGDLAFPTYKNGVYHVLKGMGKTLVRKGVTKEDLGITQVAEEFSSKKKTARALNFVFKATGLDAIDRLGKETLVNSTFSKMRSQAKRGDAKLYDELARYLEPEEIAPAIDDLKAGKLTDLTETILFNRLLDFQPLAKSEMPEKYLRHPNGRIFYMLKSFTIKQYDIFRREAVDLIVSGEPKKMAIGFKNLIHLAGVFMLANMGADKLKDVVMGRETELEDHVVDNLWRLIGASKYDVYKARTEGVGRTILTKILFPTSLFDRGYKDIENMVTDKRYKTGPLKGEEYKSELIQSVPLAGKTYYWWFGRGSQKELYNNSKQTSSGDIDFAGLPKLPKLPKL
jgi:hypothetical protein